MVSSSETWVALHDNQLSIGHIVIYYNNFPNYLSYFFVGFLIIITIITTITMTPKIILYITAYLSGIQILNLYDSKKFIKK